MQTVSTGDSLHEMPNPVFWKNKKNIITLSSAEYAVRVAAGIIPDKVLFTAKDY